MTAPHATRRMQVEYAEALEADAEISGQRCDDLVEAASYWHAAGEHAREERALLAAAEADDDRGSLSGRGSYAEFLMTHGRREEAERRLAELLHEGSDCESAYLAAAQAYDAVGAPGEALRWLNVGVNRFVPELDAGLDLGDPGMELMRARRDLRARLGLPPDVIDEFTERQLRLGREFFDRLMASRAGSGAVLYWPPAEFAELRRHRPDLELSADHAEHRRRVQVALAHRPDPVLVRGTRADLDALGSGPDVLGSHADHLRRCGRSEPWPPGRNAPCWCGSGHKYKKCCGAPGFGDSGRSDFGPDPPGQ